MYNVSFLYTCAHLLVYFFPKFQFINICINLMIIVEWIFTEQGSSMCLWHLGRGEAHSQDKQLTIIITNIGLIFSIIFFYFHIRIRIPCRNVHNICCLSPHFPMYSFLYVFSTDKCEILSFYLHFTCQFISVHFSHNFTRVRCHRRRRLRRYDRKIKVLVKC